MADISQIKLPDGTIYNLVDKTKLPLAGGTMTGQIVLASNGYRTYNAAGYSVDQHGNFTHLGTTTSDHWHLDSNNGTRKFSVYWETGNVTAAGTITASKFVGDISEGTGLTKLQVTTGLGYTPSHQPIKTASGTIATFTDGSNLPLKSLTADITAIQDLHGYDYPWVGGSGLNLFHMNSSISQTSAGVVYTSDDNYMILNNTKSGGSTANFNNTTITLPSGTYYAKAFAISGTASKVNQSFNLRDNSASVVAFDLSTVGTFTLSEEKTLYLSTTIWEDGITYNNYKIGIVVSKTSGIDKFYPYSNECPIIGFSGVEVSVVDMLGLEIVDSWLTSIGEAHSVDGDTLTINYITLKPFDNPCTLFNDDRTVTISVDSITGVATGVKIQLLDKNNTQVGQVTNLSKTFTGVGSKIRIDYGGGGQVIIKGLQIYSNGNTYSLTFTDGTNPLTVYGGYVDLVSGVLTVTYAKIALADIPKSKYGTYQYGIRTISSFFDSIPNSGLLTGMSNTFVLSDSGESYNVDKCSIVFGNGNFKTSFLISTQASGLSADASVTKINEWLRSIDAYIVYPLATPLTYQLSKQQIRSLVGDNNISANTGEVSVTYVTQEYDGLTANYASEAGGITQTPTTSRDTNEYPLLLKYSNNGSEEANIVKTTRDKRFTYKPSANALTASYYNGNTLVRETIYGSAGIRTQGQDSYNRNVNSEYLQEGFNVKYSASLSGGDLTDAGVTCKIDTGGVDGYQPQIDVYNTRYASASQDSGVSKEGVIDHESIKVYEDHFNDNYASLSSQYKGFQADKDNIYLIHQEWSQGSATPTINEVMQIGIDDITLTGNKWDGTNTSLATAVNSAKGTVTQINSTTNNWYNILFSNSTDTTDEKTEGTQKNGGLLFNPNLQRLDTNEISVAATLYGNTSNNYNISLRGTATGSNKTITLPNKTGTVALISDCIKYVQTTCTVDCSTKNLNNVYNGTKTITKPYSGTYIASICEVTSMSGWAQRADAQAQYDGNTTVYCSMISPTHGNSAVNITVTVFYI